MNQLVTKKPEHENIYLQVKEMILFGEVVPGQPVTIHGLADTIRTGITPAREAIRRLTAEGALVTRENRRIEVPAMTEHRLQQIELVRLTVEPALAEAAAQHCKVNDIDVLEQLDAQVDKAIQVGDVRGYLEANYRFHFHLYGLADAEILRRIAETLWLRIGPSLRVVCGRYGTANLIDHHRAATQALRNGDATATKDAIAQDIRQGMEFVRQTAARDGARANANDTN
ncbi:DNA-binding GntR family transcriptional regulator [Yoonia maricola]|uniref:DNA-binding GntR family transcriptional regulator n=1 Tax=Yoonia maricola TaxID=420999 RepID=A0A2M8WQD8_9RHOB|nr:GntR family transcriptional regulator [Yoonia maricola]PJI93151.1 DNA-binding GntR family transcriptional regulator [Yoonia maricola]